MGRFDVGSLVTCRTRDWVVLPSERNDVMVLRPLGGSEAEVCGIYMPIEGNTITPAIFPPPIPDQAGDFVSAQLLHDAARLSLRNGAGPFRSLGRLGVRPRPYQLVPLMMALRLSVVRLLIADDVGIGKTIEAGVIVRELLDRGEIRRLTVLCPPHLCDQWQRELRDKFAIDAVIVRSSTIARLDRSLPRDDVSIFDYYPFTIASIDYVKSERHRDGFLRSCPPCVIVDEAHTATHPHGRGGTQQQRYDLVRNIAADPQRHLLLLTATPHSGIEASFQSLLGLLRPDFADFDLASLSEPERDALAHHFIQRRRADVKDWLGEETPFPTRRSAEVSYAMPSSSAYRSLFNEVYNFARELITEHDANTPAYRQRVRYWAALALLRCVMSSPAAAEKALRSRAVAPSSIPQPISLDEQGASDHASAWGNQDTSADEVDEMLSSYVYDATDLEGTQDTEPVHVVDHGSSSSERTRLRRFADRAASLSGEHDLKLQATIPLLTSLLKDGYNPIIYCRYIATANYLANELHKQFAAGDRHLRILSVTGERSEEERETLIAELATSPRRVLVATDCLSEGINLQETFDAVVHYDLPWNPNRLEQREGRVDRYGQHRATIRTALITSQDNPMDEAVMKVLLRKAMTIHDTLGISVPLPTSSKDVLDALISNVFQATPEQLSFLEQAQQATLWRADEQLQMIEQQWEQAVKQENVSRTRFAQRRIKPQEVAQELDESDAVLGDIATVQRFVCNACERIGATLQPETTHFRLPYNRLPEAIRERIEMVFASRTASAPPDEVLLSFTSPAPQGIHSIGRNHALTTALADYLLETALQADGRGHTQQHPAARSSLIRSSRVQKRTTLLLLRVRMLIERGSNRNSSSSNDAGTPMLAEELVVAAYEGSPATTITWLDETTALDLLTNVRPDANVQADKRTIGIQNAIQQVLGMTEEIHQFAHQRAARLYDAHRRVRRAIGGGKASSDTVRPHLPPDLLGIYVIMPMLAE